MKCGLRPVARHEIGGTDVPRRVDRDRTGGGMTELRICALYPDHMNIYADRGNILFLQRRCEWRGIGFTYAGSGPGEQVDPAAHDLFYIGGGQDRDQRMVAEDMVASKREAMAAAVDDGAAGSGGLRRLPAPRALLRHRRRADRRPRDRRPGDGPRAGRAADRQRRDRGGARRRQARARRLREPRRPHLPGRRRNAAGARHLRPRQQRPRRLGGRAPREPDRHLPARPPPAEERLARRPPDPRGAHPPLRIGAGAGAAR